MIASISVCMCVCVCVDSQGLLSVLVESASRLVYLRYLHAKLFFISADFSLFSLCLQSDGCDLKYVQI